MSETLFAARDVHFAYGAAPVLQGIDLSVAAGEIVGLVGADGAGKTTLLSIGVGQLQADAGVRLMVPASDNFRPTPAPSVCWASPRPIRRCATISPICPRVSVCIRICRWRRI